MFGSTIIDVAAGVVFGFLAISLFASALTEAMNSVLGLRASTLKDGVQKLLNDPNFASLAKQLYAHALVNPLGPGGDRPDATLPSYIEPKQFAQALMEVTKLTGPTIESLRAAVAANAPDEQIRQYLLGVVERTGGDLKAMQKEIADWFDAAMDRLSGEFKRWRQFWTFVIALGAALAFNLDSIRIARTLWINPALVDNLQAGAMQKAILTDVDGVEAAAGLVNSMMAARLPAGWAPGHAFQLNAETYASACEAQKACAPRKIKWFYFFRAPGPMLAASALGWLVAAISALFGAPFWFDALQSIVQVKGAGPSPADRTRAAAA